MLKRVKPPTYSALQYGAGIEIIEYLAKNDAKIDVLALQIGAGLTQSSVRYQRRDGIEGAVLIRSVAKQVICWH